MRETRRLFSQRPVMMPLSLTKVPSFSNCCPITCPMNFSPLLKVHTTLPSTTPPLKCPLTSIMLLSRSLAKASNTSFPHPWNFPLLHQPWQTSSLPINSLPKPEGFSASLQLPQYSRPPTKVILMNLSQMRSFFRACMLAVLMCCSSSVTERTGSSRLTRVSLTLDLNLLELMLSSTLSWWSPTYQSFDWAMETQASLPKQMFYWLAFMFPSSIFRIRFILLIASFPFFSSLALPSSIGFFVIFMPWLLQFFRNLSASLQLSIWQLSATRLS